MTTWLDVIPNRFDGDLATFMAGAMPAGSECAPFSVLRGPAEIRCTTR